jgi:hypothetical protein
MIFASVARQTAPNTAEPSTVIKSTTWTGGVNGASGGCGARSGGDAGGAETVGRM